MNVFLIILLGVFFSGLFFLSDYFDHRLIKLHASLIAGISVAYFFLVVLPEVDEGLPEYPLHLKVFEYLFILIGFSFIHISEKLILQKVEGKSQKRMRKLVQMEKTLEAVEDNIEKLISDELRHDRFDKLALKEMASVAVSLHEQESEMKTQIDNYKTKIQDHINRDLHELRYFTNIAYHFLVGIILIGLLFIELIPAILFFFFAWFRASITSRSERHIIFTDLEIYEYEGTEESLPKKIISASSTISGVLLGLLFELILPINIELELLYILFSFISGVILYTIVREIIPEKEKGNPFYFLLGVIGFTIFIFILRFIQISI
ncbi:MAG: hypothetical protein GF383_10960 [Candidatus Lokiarchaeota archaeon]|nr:hypothetical protein [Candidatus Lokiarchaeota archaeon]